MIDIDTPGHTYLLGVDPGESIGIALGEFSDVDPYQIIETWQPRGGAVGFLEFWKSGAVNEPIKPYRPDLIVSERFILRSAPKDGRVPNIEPVRIEGVMLALGLDVKYQDRWMKSSVDDAILKGSGLWHTNQKARLKFEHPDARDVNDALIHSLAYLKSIKHLPTLKRYWS